MPAWLEAVVITLTVVGLALTISEIVNAYKASYDEGTGKHTYKFPVRVFVFGSLVLVALAAIVLLSLKRLFGFALIPVAALLAILLVIAILKKLGKMFWITLVALVLLVVALISYGAAVMVKNDINLNPGISVETTAPETETPETEVPETEAPETEVPETETPETEVTETEVPETTVPETEAPETEAPETDAPVADAPVIKDEPTNEGFVPVVVKINAPETMRYAEPIILTLEGVKAENLRFGNEDFLAIAILSDTEVEITLVGIVNDAGDVEFVPAAGYITVTDSETGANVTIEIVE
ncbi:MAG: hypothetical protein IKT62_05480 [Firmicutes bacterium]|nr:hypothetical protein [Bacillota bacterium]